MNKIICIVFFLLVFVSGKAEIQLPAIFADNMLIQQNTTGRMWGKASPNKKVTLITGWNLKKYTVTSDAAGNWKLEFTTPKAGGPYKMIVSDGKPLTISNVMVGELWLCSGQSNMEMPMKGYPSQPIEGSNMDVLKSENANIRLFTVRRTSTIDAQNDVRGRWEEAMPISVRDFSATAYHFGRLLQETLNVPVGLIASSWGGSSVEAWMTEDMLKAFPEVKIPRAASDIKEKMRTPTTLYNGMIHPLVGLAMRGVIWYQGESNYDRAHSYAQMFETMVRGWRHNWSQKDTIPFYYCQIAPYDYALVTAKDKEVINSAYLREAQMKAENMIPKSAMAVLMDAGEQLCIHPAKKQLAGQRLALLALDKTYGFQGIASESPVFKDIEVKNDTVVVNFEKIPLGLFAPNGESKLVVVAGADRVFYPAKATVSRNKLIVKSEAVKHPVAVRYAFENYVDGDLFGADGLLPVSSFRSDNW